MADRPSYFIGNSVGISMKQKCSAEDAQLAEKKAVALQHRSRAKSSQANSLFFDRKFLINYTWIKSFNHIWIVSKEIIHFSRVEITEEYIIGSNMYIAVIAFS